jgi:hypothetical protein
MDTGSINSIIFLVHAVAKLADTVVGIKVHEA